MDPALDNRRASDRRSQDRRMSNGPRPDGQERRRFDRRRAAAGAGLMAALAFGGVRAQQRLSEPTQDFSHTMQMPDISGAPGTDGSMGGDGGADADGASTGAGFADEDSELGRRRAALEPFIQAAAQEYGVDPNLVRAVVQTESQFDPRARSGAGAIGAMQLMPRTARSIGITNPLDPKENIFGGTKYLSTLLERFKGNTALALAGYNAGPTLVARHGRVPPIRETQNYVRKIHKLVADTDAAFHLPVSQAPRRASLKSSRSKSRASVRASKSPGKKKVVKSTAAKARAKRSARSRRA